MLSEIELKRIEKSLQPLLVPRTKPHVMSGSQVGYRVKGHEVVLFTRRPMLMEPDEEIEFELAKFKFTRTTGLWHLYWQRASGRWQGYEPFAVSENFSELSQEVLRDPYGCFWG